LCVDHSPLKVPAKIITLADASGLDLWLYGETF
jgi:hypothetical protein